MTPSLRREALLALAQHDPDSKIAAARSLRAFAHQIGAQEALSADAHLLLPGRPDRPILKAPRRMPSRDVGSLAGRRGMIHAIAHIEFNAINLALDAIWRFGGLPDDYYLDWLKVAEEEALHFELLRAHLREMGSDYGEFPSHNGLWEMAERTAGDVLARMALVPRTLEARGLDASPGIRDRLAQAGDQPAAAILQRILDDEVGHVAIGNRWFRWLCEQQGQDPIKAYTHLAWQHRAPKLRPPFNLPARRQAGFSDEELALLEA